MAKKFTVMIIPEGTHRIKRFRLPRLVFPLLMAVLVTAIAMAGYWYHQYQRIQADLPHLEALQRQTTRQEAQIVGFSQRLLSFKRQMRRLDSFHKRLRVMANLGKPRPGEDIFGIGGPLPSAGGPGLLLSGSARERQLQAMRRDLDALASQWETQRMVQQQLAKFLKERHSVLSATPSVWPVRGWVTSSFGMRISPFTGRSQFHHGLDISTRSGSKIRAPADGVVTFVGRSGGYGNILVINHGYGLVSRYGHLRSFAVKIGQKVKRNQVIAHVGNSGRSTGPHLHYEVMLAGVPTNPMYYILED